MVVEVVRPGHEPQQVEAIESGAIDFEDQLITAMAGAESLADSLNRSLRRSR